MAIRQFKPITAGRRFMVGLTYDEIDKTKPEKSLVKGRKDRAGRARDGRISVRRRGGRPKHLYRSIDFGRRKYGIPGVVRGIEYDPNRSAHIALIQYEDGERRYILAPKGIKSGDRIVSGGDAPLSVGNSLPLEKIPLGSTIHNIELQVGKGGQIARAAGTRATLMAREGDYVTIRLPSGEIRIIFKECSATIGSIGNENQMNINLGKAGSSRHLGRRPKVRGVVMNPVDHPHGGGEGRTSGGRHPVSPTGVPTKGYKTRKKRKRSNKFIVKRRR